VADNIMSDRLSTTPLRRTTPQEPRRSPPNPITGDRNAAQAEARGSGRFPDPRRIVPTRLAAILALLPFGQATLAQRAEREPDSFINQQRRVEEEVRRRFEREDLLARTVTFDFGGWYSPYLFLFDDGVNSSRTLRRHDLRVWARLGIDQGAHEVYVRTRLSLIDFNSGDSFDGNEDDVEGPNLERGYYRVQLNRALDLAASFPLDMWAGVGRDLVQLGTGLALASPLDHVALRLESGNLVLSLFAGKSVGSNDDFDLSRTAARTHRDFAGAELRYRGFERHEPFAYAFRQWDSNDEQRRTRGQRFDYDSWYAGLGSTGELVKGLRYLVEGVYEGGRAYGDGQWRRRNAIHSWAMQSELEYLFDDPRRTRASLKYLFAGGDADRRFSPTNSISGNRGDGEDSSFIGFGWQDTGLSFAPRYANLHMWRIGASLYPWPDHASLRKVQLGADGYLFHKHHRGAAVSDPSANRSSGYLGWEVDGYANWEIRNDLFWTARFGVFFPGSAFDDRTARSFLLVGMTWSF
jgi:hypothetical protein